MTLNVFFSQYLYSFFLFNSFYGIFIIIALVFVSSSEERVIFQIQIWARIPWFAQLNIFLKNLYFLRHTASGMPIFIAGLIVHQHN